MMFFLSFVLVSIPFLESSSALKNMIFYKKYHFMMIFIYIVNSKLIIDNPF